MFWVQGVDFVVSDGTPCCDAHPTNRRARTTGTERMMLAPHRKGLPNGMRLSCGAEEERSQINDYLRDRGAASFRRLLGCAPMIVAWVLPWSAARAPRHRRRIWGRE